MQPMFISLAMTSLFVIPLKFVKGDRNDRIVALYRMLYSSFYTIVCYALIRPPLIFSLKNVLLGLSPLLLYPPSSLFIPCFSLISLRNYVLAPLLEEVFFRALLPCSPLFSSLLFALSHAHEDFDPVQIVYTLAFGAMMAQLARTGILGAVLAHALCNLGGLPEFDKTFLIKGSVWGCAVWVIVYSL